MLSCPREIVRLITERNNYMKIFLVQHTDEKYTVAAFQDREGAEKLVVRCTCLSREVLRAKLMALTKMTEERVDLQVETHSPYWVQEIEVIEHVPYKSDILDEE